jgi:glycosyltransferase involved in cell wall biosynthesis
VKIAIDARELRTSTGRYVERLLHYLQEIDHKSRYLVLLKPSDFEGWQPKATNFEKIICPYNEFTFAEQIGYLRQLNKLRPDLVHFAMTQQPVLYRGKVVSTIHDLTTARFRNPAKNSLVFWLKQQVYKRVIKRVAKKSIKVITGSQFVKDDVAQYAKVDPQKILVTYEAADKTAGKAEPVIELESKQFIFYVGRAQPHKNLRRLIDAHHQLRQKYPELLLVLAGKTDENYRLIENYAKKRSAGGVVFLGYIPDSQLKWLYQHAQAYVFPSLSEGFGLPGLEAMLYGLPLAAAHASCLPEIYKDGAIYFNPRDSKDMAEKIGLLLEDRAFAKKLSQKGVKVASGYSWQRMAKQTLEVYQSVLNKNT